MDISTSFWDFVHLLNNEPYENIKNNPLFQRIVFASYLNRRFILKDDMLVEPTILKCGYTKGVSYEHHSACYVFENFTVL